MFQENNFTGSRMNFKENGFQAIESNRPNNLRLLLQKFKTIIYTDIDTIWQKDPRPFFQGRHDFWGQLDGIMHGEPYTQ